MMGAASPSDLLGKTVQDVVHPNCIPLVKERIRRVLQGEAVAPVEEKFIRLDGRVIDVEVSSYPFRYEGQTAVQLIVKDISEKKQAETSMRKTETLFTQLFQNSPLAIVILDDQGTVVQINQGFYEMFGFTLDELRGKGLNQFIVPEALEAEGNDLNSLISSYQVIRI